MLSLALDQREAQLQLLEQELAWFQDSSRSIGSRGFSQIVCNLKAWELDRDVQLLRFLSQSPSVVIRETMSLPPLVSASGESVARVRVSLEQLGTLEGSGCAIIGTLRSCPIVPDALPALVMLVAGEGSRLWGISASVGMVKGLTNVLGVSLLEQTAHQGLMLMAQAPARGANMVLIAGSDNVVLPSRPLRDMHGTPFAELRATPGANHFFCFSKEVQVLDETDELISESILSDLEQLGVMLVDENSHPTLFIEKAPRAVILEQLAAHRRRSVFFNAFCFALSCEAASWIASRYAAHFQTKDFDWSAHILEPLACYDAAEWSARFYAKRSQPFQDVAVWNELYTIAVEFRALFGAPVILSIGKHATWYDSGMAKDVYSLYQQAVSRDELERNLIRRLFGIATDANTVDSLVCNGRLAFEADEEDENGASRALVVRSVFHNGGTIGVGAVVVNSVFLRETHVPPGAVVVDSQLDTIVYTPTFRRRLLAYSVIDSTLLLSSFISDDCVYFSTHLPACERTYGRGITATGMFPLAVVPKQGSDVPYLSYYNIAENAGKPYLEQHISGLPSGLSFRELQAHRLTSLEFVVDHICKHKRLVVDAVAMLKESFATTETTDAAADASS